MEEQKQQLETLIKKLFELTQDNQELREYLDDLAFEYFGYD